MKNPTPQDSELGRKSEYDAEYNPDKLFAIPRQGKRDEIGVPSPLPFFGFDLWNHYEVSWLNERGKPIVALAEISYSCETPFIIESKSMKLYFNSFNNSSFKNVETIAALVKKDIAERVGGDVSVTINPLHLGSTKIFSKELSGICLDELDVECSTYIVEPNYLRVEGEVVRETLFSNLLKSNCLVTNQPDWGSVQIIYQGKKINHEGLLRYLVSFRNHNEFHEQCIERIFIDIMKFCQPQELTVYGRYTRRGGLDINPYRSTNKDFVIENSRLCRQ